MRVAVAGGGIAGLTAAVALAARGFSVEIFERAPELQEIGAGIQLSPNAMAVLDRLGVAAELQGAVFEPEALVIGDARSGATLTRLPLRKAMRARYGSPYCTLHRADLQAVLLAVARRSAAIRVSLGAEVRDVRAADTNVFFAAGGLSRKSDVLIGADGVRSHVRTGTFGYPGPRILARTAWRATVPAAEAADNVSLDVTGLWLGANAHLVHYPVRNGALLNVVVIAETTGPKPPIERFKGGTRDLLEAVPEWTPSPLLDVDCTLSWSRGRIALIGDAAHAMAPSAAQGGAQAIEDAWILARSLANNASSPVRALASFERTRRARVERVAQEAQRNLNTYELSGVPAILRNAVLIALPASFFLSRLDWLFGWRPE